MLPETERRLSWNWMPCELPASFVVMLFLCTICLIVSGPLFGQEHAPLTQAPPRDYRSLEPPSVPFRQGPVIPGLQQNAVPQGITYSPEHDKILMSHDFEQRPSCISIVDNTNGTLTSSVALKEGPDEFHHGHVGGLAILNGSLWVASDGKLLQYELEPFLSEGPPASAVPITVQQTETKASFCAATADALFVGEFAYGPTYRTDEAHHLKDRAGIRKYAWVCAYSADNPTGTPKFVLSIRQRVQGIHVADRHIYLSLSYGRQNRSTIVVYRNPLREAPHSQVTTSDGTAVPLWFLDGGNYLREIDYPPMAEGITMIGNRLAVLSESGAMKYQRRGEGPLDVILLLDVQKSE